MAPVIDGPAGFIPDHPLVLREKGLINHVPIITGLNREDGSLYTYWRESSVSLF
jgi:carboxylesterase type B